MAHSLPHASPFAELDAKRIAGNSLAVAIHVLAIGILLMPSTWEPLAKPAPRELTVVPIHVKPPEIRIPDPPPTNPPRVPDQQRTRPVVRTPVNTTPVPDADPVFDTGDIQAIPTAEGPFVDTFGPRPPALATLAYDVYPAPRYPRISLRRGDTGTVLLKVLVDENGRPTEVLVERSSGHRELDRAAREQVLANWRFHPALQQGRPVPAYAMVPIDFRLP